MMRVLAAALMLTVAGTATMAAPLSLPPRTRRVLNNGMTVIVVPTKRVPLVALRLVMRAGSEDDPVGKEGLANLTASLLTQGAGSRSADRVADDIAFVGGRLEARAQRQHITVACEVLSRDLDLALELVRDVTLAPAFSMAEVTRKREQIVGQIVSVRDDPGRVAERLLPVVVLGESPLSHPVAGFEESVAELSRDDVTAFHHRHVRPERAYLVIVGDVDVARVMRRVARTFEGWRGTPTDLGSLRAATEPPYSTRVVVVARPQTTQVQVRFGAPSVARDDPDRAALDVANAILGGGFTSRLVDELRTVRGLTYTVFSTFLGMRGAGLFEISSFTKNATLREAVDLILAVTRRLVAEGPTEEEVEKARRYLTGQFPLELQAPGDLADRLSDVELYGLPADELESYVDRVNGVTRDQCRKALAAHVKVDELRLVVVGDPAVVRPALAGLGEMEVAAGW